MRPFIIIRKYTNSDCINCKDLVKNYVMSFVSSAFLSCIFREITLQLIVLVWAILFIFFGIPLIFCALCVPFVIFFIYCCIYGSYYTKAVELADEKGNCSWVAVAYEPYFIRCSPKEMSYDIISEQSLLNNDLEINKMRKTIIGTISVRTHNVLNNADWICRMAIHPSYRFEEVGESLVNRVLKYSYNNNVSTVEISTTECQYECRELLLKNGFTIKQIYHKPVVGIISLRIMKSQMGIDLNDWSSLKNK